MIAQNTVPDYGDSPPPHLRNGATGLVGLAPPHAAKGQAMEKWMCYGALGIAGLMLVIFLADLFTGVVFGGPESNPFVMVDIFGVLASGVVAYLGYSALRDVK